MCGCILGGDFQFVNDRESVMVWVWAAPEALKTIPLVGVLRPPPFASVSGAPWPPRTPSRPISDLGSDGCPSPAISGAAPPPLPPHPSQHIASRASAVLANSRWFGRPLATTPAFERFCTKGSQIETSGPGLGPAEVSIPHPVGRGFWCQRWPKAGPTIM